MAFWLFSLVAAHRRRQAEHKARAAELDRAYQAALPRRRGAPDTGWPRPSYTIDVVGASFLSDTTSDCSSSSDGGSSASCDAASE